MKRAALSMSMFVALFFIGVSAHAAENEVTGAILGNDPQATLTTGIGQVITPIGPAVVAPPAASYITPVPMNPQGRPPAPVVPPADSPYRYKERDVRKVDDRYKLGEIDKMSPEEKRKARRAAAIEIIESNKLVGQMPGGLQNTPAVGETTSQVRKNKPVSVPTQPYPKVQTIPYR